MDQAVKALSVSLHSVTEKMSSKPAADLRHLNSKAVSGNCIAIGYVVVEHGNAVSLMPALETTTYFVDID